MKLVPPGRVYITFVVDQEYPQLPKTGKVIAVDVGVEKLLTTSDGQIFPNVRPYEKALDKVKRLHRALSRKEFLI